MEHHYELFYKYVKEADLNKLIGFYDEHHKHFDISADNDYAFRIACTHGKLRVAQWLYQIKPTIDISINHEHAFWSACCNGHLDIAQWLYQIKPNIDISANNDKAFYTACVNGHLLVAQWLYQIKPDISIYTFQRTFSATSHFNYDVITQWLLLKCPYIHIYE